MNSLKLFEDDCKKYFNVHGFFKRRPSDPFPDGNPNVYNGTYTCIRHLLGWIPSAQDRAKFHQRISKIMDSPGTLDRGVKKKKDRNSYDDYIGVGSESYFTDDGSVAHMIYMRGKNNWWYFRNQELGFFESFTFSNFFWRIPAFIPHIKLCASKFDPKIKLSLFNQIMWSLDIFVTSLTEMANINGRQKDFLFITPMRLHPEYKICQVFIKIRDFLFLHKYPNGLMDIMTRYYEASHAFANNTKKLK